MEIKGDLEDPDSYMTESLAEAEKEVQLQKQGKGLSLTEEIEKLEKESKQYDMPKSNGYLGKDSSEKNKIVSMSNEMVENALSSKSIISYQNGEVDVQTMDARNTVE
jgi:hypothetical protein